MKVELTQAQAEFIESFKGKDQIFKDAEVKIGENLPFWATTAIYNISRFGYGHGMVDGDGKEVSRQTENPDHYEEFKQKSKALLISAVINGYTVKKEDFVLYIEFEDNTDKSEERRLYYGAGYHVTDKHTATVFPTFGVPPEKLMEQGWKKEVL